MSYTNKRFAILIYVRVSWCPNSASITENKKVIASFAAESMGGYLF